MIRTSRGPRGQVHVRGVLRRTCTCGRHLDRSELLSLTGRRRCPDCGSRSHRWEGPAGSWLRRFLPRKEQAPRYTPERPGPRFLSADYGFHLLATVLFAKPTEPGRELFVKDELHLTRNKNRWRFWHL